MGRWAVARFAQVAAWESCKGTSVQLL